MVAELLDEEAIFKVAVEIPSEDARSTYLQQVCGNDRAMFDRVLALLCVSCKAHDFLESPPAAFAATATMTAVTATPGEIIGPYKLRELLAEGGMGSVFVAEQEQPIRRKVALKVIKPGMDSRQVLRRFEAERQALALMDHPNIAKVLDAGVTDGGRPYFVMELVRGVPITEFCDQRRLDPRQRLELFVQVCRAIQHAHQKGVIHRDVKPSNILVTLHDDLAVPKVIDFGIAKAAGQRLTDQSVYTAFNQMIGTPLYMSPEQAEMNALDVDTRSDVYSLGVLLYELLTGSTPFDGDALRRAGFDEMRRLIREVDPPRPSQRVSTLNAESASTVSQGRGVDQRRLHRALRGDLDRIVMKCLQKDRNRRYESASDLAEDVQRHLDGEPIEARPPRLFAGARKWSRRHRSMVWASATTLLVSALVIAASAGWTINDRQSRQATLKAQVLLTLDNIQAAYDLDKLQDAAAALQQAESLVSAGAVDATIAARVRQWKTDLQTVERLEEARMSNTTKINDDRWEYAASPASYQLAFASGGWDIAGGKPSDLVARLRKSLIKAHLVAALDDWASLSPAPEQAKLFALSSAADDDPWRNSLRSALADDDIDRLKQVAQNEQRLAQSRLTFVTVINRLMDAGAREFAVDLLKRVQPQHPADFWVNYTLGSQLVSESPHEAIGYLIVAISQRPSNGAAYNSLGNAYYLSDQYDRAEPAFHRAVELRPECLGDSVMLVRILLKLDRSFEAEAPCRTALRVCGPQPLLHLTLGDVLEAQGRVGDAISAYQEAIRLTPDNTQDVGLLNYIAWLMATSTHDELRDGERALALATRACTLCNFKSASVVDTLAGAYAELGDFDNAVKWTNVAIELDGGAEHGRRIIGKHRDRYLAGQPWRKE